MTRLLILMTVLLLCLLPALSCAELAGTVSDDYEPMYTFAEPYGFRLGGAFGFWDMQNAVYMDFLDDHFNSLTCTNETKAYSLLDQNACRRSEDGMPRMNFTNADKMIAWCREHGKGVRGHVLVWDAVMQYPWFFHEGYDEKKPFADPEVNRARLASYIDQVITHFEEKFPGVIYCWDVVNEAIGDSASDWRADDPRHIRIVRDGRPNFFQAYVGDDYVEYAFLCARNTVDRLGKDIRLFYNDYNMFMKEKRSAAAALAESIRSYDPDGRPLIDGIGMQGYLGGYGVQEGCLEDHLITDVKETIALFSSMGLEVQITEMAVRNFDKSKAELHADFYGRLFSEVFMQANSGESRPLTAVCIWGLVDAPEGKQDYVYKMNSPYGCFLSTKYEIKTCFDRVYHVLKGE
ncbi:MAG: endo-1,4-beta-xylanase [Clostridiales bacterium]|nr:endo-1,4-beta-xylanase [Clostridiales bacterium]